MICREKYDWNCSLWLFVHSSLLPLPISIPSLFCPGHHTFLVESTFFVTSKQLHNISHGGLILWHASVNSYHQHLSRSQIKKSRHWFCKSRFCTWRHTGGPVHIQWSTIKPSQSTLLTIFVAVMENFSSYCTDWGLGQEWDVKYSQDVSMHLSSLPLPPSNNQSHCSPCSCHPESTYLQFWCSLVWVWHSCFNYHVWTTKNVPFFDFLIWHGYLWWHIWRFRDQGIEYIHSETGWWQWKTNSKFPLHPWPQTNPCLSPALGSRGKCSCAGERRVCYTFLFGLFSSHVEPAPVQVHHSFEQWDKHPYHHGWYWDFLLPSFLCLCGMHSFQALPQWAGPSNCRHTLILSPEGSKAWGFVEENLLDICQERELKSIKRLSMMMTP